MSTVIVTMIEQTWVEALSIAEGQEKWANVRNKSVDVEVNKTEGIKKSGEKEKKKTKHGRGKISCVEMRKDGGRIFIKKEEKIKF